MGRHPDMGVVSFSSCNAFRSLSFLLNSVLVLSFFSLGTVLLLKADHYASHTRTVVGHNLQPTPWHPFAPKSFDHESRYSRTSKIIKCSYLTCANSINSFPRRKPLRFQSSNNAQCPDFFRYIHRDLEPWAKTRISMNHLMQAKNHAAFRVVIVGGRLYVDFYYACVQSRTMFTVWGILQLLMRYPGMVPDVDLMFDCMDKPVIQRSEHESMPLPLFRYCTTPDHFDIPFPDWSFWGCISKSMLISHLSRNSVIGSWWETNVEPWDQQFRDIKRGSQSEKWAQKLPTAYWKGNPDVASPIRTNLLQCNDSAKWGAQIFRQNWFDEAKAGYAQSKLSNQCKHRYKVYAEGYAWSVSLKYILSCGSPVLIINPQYEDFLSRGLIPKKNYWPVSPIDLCPSIKVAVAWGNANPSKAEAIGKNGQRLMETTSMDRVYDYMFHLLNEYSKLQDFKPEVPPNAQEICEESLLCYAEPKETQYLKTSTAFPSPVPSCTLPAANSELIQRWDEEKKKTIMDVQGMMTGLKVNEPRQH